MFSARFRHCKDEIVKLSSCAIAQRLAWGNYHLAHSAQPWTTFVQCKWQLGLQQDSENQRHPTELWNTTAAMRQTSSELRNAGIDESCCHPAPCTCQVRSRNVKHSNLSHLCEPPSNLCEFNIQKLGQLLATKLRSCSSWSLNKPIKLNKIQQKLWRTWGLSLSFESAAVWRVIEQNMEGSLLCSSSSSV